MRQEKLGFSIIIRVFISFLPLLFGMPIISVIMCAYNMSMSFVVFGPLSAFVSALSSVCIAMFIGGTYGASGELSGLVLALQAILASLGCIYGYLYKRKFPFGLMLSTAGVLVPQFMYIQYIASMDGLSVAQAVIPSAEDLSSMISQIFEDMQVKLTLTEVNQVVAIISKFVTLLLPSIFILSSLVLAYVIMWTVSAQLRKLPVGLSHSFSLIKIPKITVFFALVSTILIFAFEYMSVSSDVVAVIMNMSVILLAVCAFSGISLLDFYLRKKVKFTFFRIVIYSFLIMFIPVTPIILILLAWIDSFANFRRIVQNTPSEKGDINETEK